MKQLLLLLLLMAFGTSYSQDTSSLMSLSKRPLKITHAEPIYMDLIRDLGARKGEKEWNTGLGIQQRNGHSSYTGFVEYEFSPLHRLGLEVEIPFVLSRHREDEEEGAIPPAMEGVKWTMQYTFWVSERYQMSMAAGNLYELELASPQFGNYQVSGHWYNPFLIVAKRWRSHFHSMLYVGPVYQQKVNAQSQVGYQLNASLFYVIPSTKNFVGLELNQEQIGTFVGTVLRPEVKVKLAPSLALGLATGISIQNPEEGMSFFSRFIYEL